MHPVSILAAVVIIVAIVVIFLKPGLANEQFDTYNNHTLGAEDVYNTELKTVGKQIDFSGAQLVSKYSWASKDPTGRNVYDKYYEAIVQEKNNGDVTANKTGYTNPYDSKFDIHPADGSEGLSGNSYNLRDMYDNEPMFTEVMGETIVLSQANY